MKPSSSDGFVPVDIAAVPDGAPILPRADAAGAGGTAPEGGGAARSAASTAVRIDPAGTVRTSGPVVAAPDGAPQVQPAQFGTPLGQGPFAKARPSLGWAHPDVQRQITRESERARAQARSLGYAAGWAEGRRAAAAELEAEQQALREQTKRLRAKETAQLRRAVQALAEAATNAEYAAAPAWEELADVIAEGALGLARAALGRELGTVDDAVVDQVRTALHRLGEPQVVSAHLNPDDLALVAEVPNTPLPAGFKFVADEAVPQGGATVQTPTQRLRMSLPTALAAAEEVLRCGPG